MFLTVSNPITFPTVPYLGTKRAVAGGTVNV